MTAETGWYTTEISYGTIVVVPLDDTIIHQVHRSESCPCDPDVEHVQTAGGCQLMYTHNALDGRP